MAISKWELRGARDVPTDYDQSEISGSSYKAFFSAGGLRRPLRSLRKEKYIKILCEAGSSPRLNVVYSIMVGSNWRLDNSKTLAAMLGENSPDATYASPPWRLPYVRAYPR